MITTNIISTIIGSLYLFWGVSNATAAAAAEGLQHHKFKACSFNTPLKDSDAESSSCYSSIYAPISQVYDCLSTFELTPKNVIQHLQSTIDVLNDHYVFKDIAVNPSLTLPLKTPFDSPIYNGTDGGQADIISGLNDLLGEVRSKNYATLDTLFEMNALGAKLFDAHLKINGGISKMGGMITQSIRLYSSEVLNGNAESTKLIISFPTQRSIEKENSGFVLIEEFVSSTSGEKTRRIIQQIDGKEPLDFLIDMARKPLGLFSYKSVGARVQSLIQRLTMSTTMYKGAFASLFGQSLPNMSKLLKDTYEVRYEDGGSTSTTWHLLQNVPSSVSCDKSKSQIEKSIDEPGKMYQDLQSMKQSLHKNKLLLHIKQEEMKQQQLPDSIQAISRGFDNDPKGKSNIDFTMVSRNLGYKVFEDYAVLKVATFSRDTGDTGDSDSDTLPTGVSEYLLLKAWNDMTTEAQSKNVTKLIIDVIANGGGTVQIGYYLAQLLYPEATWEEMANPYDRLYTPSMQDDVGALQGKMASYLKIVQNDTMAKGMTDALNDDTNLLLEKLDSILNLFQSMLDIGSSDEFVTESTAKFYLEGTIFGAMESVKRTKTIVLEKLINIEEGKMLSAEYPLVLSRTTTGTKGVKVLDTSQFQTVWHILLNVAHEIFDFPFQAMQFKKYFGAEFSSATTEVSKSVEHIRGGILGNYTSPFYVLDPTTITRWNQVQTIQHPKQFDHYILLSSGASCGSTTDTFKNTAKAYAYTKNSKQSGSTNTVVPPFHTVSFGGTGKKEDAATTQFSGGAMGKPTGVDLYLKAIIFQILHTLLPDDSQTEASYLNDFHKVIPDACYYCDGPMQMPYYEIYSRILGADGPPLEYVKQVPDHYIRQWPTKLDFMKNDDLPMLYKLTSRFFFETTK